MLCLGPNRGTFLQTICFVAYPFNFQQVANGVTVAMSGETENICELVFAHT